MNIEQRIQQARRELALKKIGLNFKKTFNKSIDDILSIFEGSRFMKRSCDNRIIIFEHTDFTELNDFANNEPFDNIFTKEMYLIRDNKNEIIIDYFEFKDTVCCTKGIELVENIKDEQNRNILFNIKYEIKLGSENSVKIIKNYKKSQNKIYDTFGKLFIKSLEYANMKSGLAADILKLYYEDKAFNNEFNFSHIIDDKDFENFNSLFEFFSSKYNVSDDRLIKIPLSIMEEFFKDEFLRLEENSFVLDFIIKNKKHFLAERMNVEHLKDPKGIIESYFFASGTYYKFYNSRMKEYDIMDEKRRLENEKNKKENKPIVIYCERKRKGTNRYVREIIMETFYYGKDLNIRDIVKRIAICSSFNELEKLHSELETKSEMMTVNQELVKGLKLFFWIRKTT